ncbi:arabinoxylan arabinofuranohydrolase XynD [Thermoclostridium stercorarium subsp. stercorarium DSM 8532]|uniref:Arabinoxylan arabinofuranohydrolase XynD n=3 Tax=Thermoclostridium stercorarium TaxID=1510 RepID=L7VMM8_THES1|nr:family 43 glycosylhydrolase [Thermoclostridium stercorarium]AGC67716.1 arabinoxylan arabinofuranohydrolase XynD [Thermoclostridium stercorarium subsp. stercorarium DSM 8532]AGI38767.1 beta-xylosidase [Thermoclostridium stercorarium subsp. stercorarium DSM 8532]ANW98131.1 carbohydrate-binding protein [Thermoclostridium stercorarium subsp. thermolacticum DSM 2910]
MNTFSRRNLLVAISVAVIAILVILSGILANKYRETSGNVKEKEAVVTEKDFGMAKNPIIWADFPDPDVIRIDGEYYMVSTTMHMMPGTPVLRSTDLVNWEIISYTYERLEENDAHNLRNGLNIYGKGAWAPCIRYHNGKFYVLFAALDTGKTYLFSADNPKGPWERTEFREYFHDPSLLFDDDGKAYIIYGRTNIMIKELTSDYKAVSPSGLNKVIIASGQEGMEGSHAYKINGKYYITTIWWENGNIRRQYVYRADQIDGPYEGRLVLSDTMGYKEHGVAQGGLVDTPDGKWYAMLFQDHDAVGRVPVLVPVRWEDGWPVYGDEEGKVPIQFNKPGDSSFVSQLIVSDEFYQEDAVDVNTGSLGAYDYSDAKGSEFVANSGFNDLMNVDDVSAEVNALNRAERDEALPNGSVLGLTWQWNHNPENTKWSLTDRKGYLRLWTCNEAENILQARNVLTQRTQGPYCSGWILMDVTHMLDGDYAGLAAFQQEYGFIGVTRQDNDFYIVMVDKGVEKARTKLMQRQVYLKVDFDFTVDEAAFFYSYNGRDWNMFGGKLAMRYTIPHFMGYRFAIFNYATKQTGGYVDVDFFRFADRLTGTGTSADLKAYLTESEIELSGDPETVCEFGILINEVPGNESIYGIHASLVIPEELAVIGVDVHEKNLNATKVELEPKDGRYDMMIYNTGGQPISFINYGLDKELVSIKFRLSKKIPESFSKEILVKSVEFLRVNNQKTSYDVDSAILKVTFSAPSNAVGKVPPNGNPLISHKFGADPCVLVYKDRVYVYMTNDILEYDEKGEVKDNTYGRINKISVISSDDLMNWTDHGEIHVAGPQGAAKWASQSWAPAIAHKVVNGKDKFFLYFSNNASGIGVLTGDSPVGPWEDPLGRPLISRSTPGVKGVVWLFDPAVLTDDDGKAYIYFGGGVPDGRESMPDTARVMQLGDDMISVVGEAVTIPVPFMFEASGINKYKGVYYFTYCANFYSGPRPEGSPQAGVIAYMTSSGPMGPWKYGGTVLKNPGHFFGVGGNNHHSLFEFKGKWYIVYHAQTLAKAMGIPKGYRSPHLNQVFFNDDGTIQEVIANNKGVPQVKYLDPYTRVEAETFAWNAGVSTKTISEGNPAQRALTDIDNGDWIGLSKVDFGNKGASTFTAMVSNVSADSIIEIHLDSVDGKLVGTLAIPAGGGKPEWKEYTTEVSGVHGVHNLYLVFKGKSEKKLFDFDYWYFSE